jgi:hypothetical protein
VRWLPTPRGHSGGPEISDKATGRNLEGAARLRRGAIGTAALLILVEWMMEYPKRWLLDAGLAVPASPPTATPVVPEITEAIGLAVIRLERASR